MEKRKRVLELRDRMDRTLALPDLADEASLRALVKKQILASTLPGGSEEGLRSVYSRCLLLLINLIIGVNLRLINVVLVVVDHRDGSQLSYLSCPFPACGAFIVSLVHIWSYCGSFFWDS